MFCEVWRVLHVSPNTSCKGGTTRHPGLEIVMHSLSPPLFISFHSFWDHNPQISLDVGYHKTKNKGSNWPHGRRRLGYRLGTRVWIELWIMWTNTHVPYSDKVISCCSERTRAPNSAGALTPCLELSPSRVRGFSLPCNRPSPPGVEQALSRNWWSLYLLV